MRRGALVLAVLAATVVATVLVTRDDRGGDGRTTAEPRASRPRVDIRQPAQRIPCPNPAYSGAEDQRPSFDARQLLGMAFRAAERRAARAGCSVRVVSRDGQGLVRTDDIVVDRINVEVESGIVVGIDDVG